MARTYLRVWMQTVTGLCVLNVAYAQTPSAASSLSARQKHQAEDAYLTGAKQLDKSEYAAAEKSFVRALTLAPGDRAYLTALALAREHHITDLVQTAGRERLQGDAATAERLVAEAKALEPENAMVLQHELPGTARPLADTWRMSAPVYAGAIVPTPDPKPASFHLRADLQEVVRQVAAGYGMKAVFDDSAPHLSLRFDLEDVRYEQAMPILLQMGHLFAVPLDPRTLLIAKDTADNRQRLERQMQETISLPGLTTEQIGDIGNVLRNIFEVRQATTQSGLGTLLVRAPEATLKAINLTLEDLLGGDSEVLLELKLYSVDLTHNRMTGVSVPQQVGAYNVASQAQALVTANQSIVDQAIAQGLISATSSVLQIAEYLIASGVATSSLLSSTLGIFGGGITTTGVYVTGGVSLNLGLSSSDARALDDIQLRVEDRKEGTFRVGTRYPITTATYSSGVSATSASLAGVTINGVSAASLLAQLTGGGSGTTVPQVQYEDLGLTLKATPTISKTNAVHLKMDLKIEALAGGSNNNIPILANRQLVSDVTVNDGETAMILSNVNRSEQRAINGLPGLSELPGFQSATDRTVEVDSGQLVLLLTPHIVRRRTNAFAGPRIAFAPPRAGN